MIITFKDYGVTIVYDSRPRRTRLLHQYKDWHTWFAWRPVFVSPGELVWLQDVDRVRDAHQWNYAPHNTMCRGARTNKPEELIAQWRELNDPRVSRHGCRPGCTRDLAT